MGIIGGIARKVMKLVLDIPRDAPHVQSEISGNNYDIDVIVLVEKVTKELTYHVINELTGRTIGGLVVEAKDVEVLVFS